MGQGNYLWRKPRVDGIYAIPNVNLNSNFNSIRRTMPGTVAGGLKCAATNKAKYGDDWYKKIGAIGGRNGNTGGFASNHTLAQLAGAKGGRLSRRGKSPKTIENIRRAKELREHGITVKNIAVAMQVTESTIYRWLEGR